ncbi:CBS domain-containing protein [Vulcanisaeta thermophila]|uniref:CBS domain-containing protein n=1 Tax=Vulcanisaeta thermophila TaxID=867917 RepID=UPI0008536DEE|nr:CBS domain-containing protein [Vulcanisaeta thermophila]
MDFTADKLIRRKPIVIDSNATVKDAVNLMAKENIGLVVIVNAQGDPVGVISERDVIRALAQGKNLNSKVTEVGTVGKLITVKPSDSIYKVALLMNDHGIRHVLVVNNEGKLQGVISIRDIISEQRVISRLAEVAEAKPSEEIRGGD